MTLQERLAEKERDLIYWQRRLDRRKTDYERAKVRAIQERIAELKIEIENTRTR